LQTKVCDALAVSLRKEFVNLVIIPNQHGTSMAKSRDLFDSDTSSSKDYTAKDIEVLEGLEPVRRRPGM